MRLSEYNKIPALSPADRFVIDTVSGTKSISAEDLAKSLSNLGSGNGLSIKIQDLDVALNLKENDALAVGTEEGTKKIAVSDAFFKLIDPILTAEGRRNVWRGKNLGSVVTDEQWNEIAAGTFRGMFTGDYWEIDNRIWRIVDFNYWLGSGDTECTTPHLNIMPDTSLASGNMNESNTTNGGYANSNMAKTSHHGARAILDNVFGTDHLLAHKEYFANAVTNGHPSGWGLYNNTIALPNEIMMYGCPIFTSSNNGTTVPSLHTIDKTQLAAMRLNPSLINPHREDQWLRDVVSEGGFASVSKDGYANMNNASSVRGVRPVFGIKAA